MIARVYNPIGMADLRNIISNYESTNHGELSTGSAGSTPPDSADIARVRRNLFGPVDHEENRRFLERELALAQVSSGDRWGFDFDKGTPRTSGLGTKRYSWEKVKPTEDVPVPYALLGMTSLQNVADVDDDTTPEEAATTAATPMIGVEDERESAKSVGKTQRQSHITEYMQKRKHPYSNGAKSLSGGDGKKRSKAPRAATSSATSSS